MKVVEARPKSIASGKSQPFFSKRGGQDFFATKGNDESFFIKPQTPLIQAKPASIIQRQEKPDESDAKDTSPGTKQPVPQNPSHSTPRITKCNINPAFPDFGCLAGQLKLDIDDNLRSNAHQFYSVASLYPGDKELMWNTFMRYGIGVNLLQTSFRFLGANERWSNVLSYGTGVALKSYQFIQSGELKLDIPIPLGNGVNLDIKFDLDVDPNNVRDVRGVNTSVGISGRF